ncbi:MAG: AsnC family transcriptional regulator [Nitrososphaerales archaeon]
MVNISRIETTQRIVEAIKKVGPRNCAEIARLTNIPERTVREKVKRQLEKKGILVRVNVDLAKLGLTQLWVTLKFNEEVEEVATRVLRALSKVGYLTYHAKILPNNYYVALFAVPRELKDRYSELFESLLELKIIKRFKLHELSWLIRPSMRTEYYNFDMNEWLIDWGEIERSSIRLYNPVGDTPIVNIDKIDLALLSKLQINATLSLREIAKALNLNPKTLGYHMREHLLRKGVITGYNIIWFGPPTGPTRKWILNLIIEMDHLEANEVNDVRVVFNKIPFLYSEAYSYDGFYGTQIFLPAIHYTDLISYLSKNLRTQADRLSIGFVDRSDARGYTIPYEMFKDGKWFYNVDETIELFKRLAIELKLKE